MASWVDGDVVADWAEDQEGKPYAWNYCYKDERNAFYCSHLDWAAFIDTYGIDMDSNTVAPPPLCGDWVMPEDLYWDSDNWLVDFGD